MISLLNTLIDWLEIIVNSLLDQPGQLPQKSVALLKPPIILGSVLFVSAAAITGLWAFMARIPEKVMGIGILQPVESIFRVRAHNAGTLLYPFYKQNNRVEFGIPDWSDEAYNFIQNPANVDDDELFKLTSNILRDIQDFSTTRVNLSIYSGSEDSGAHKKISLKSDDVIGVVYNLADTAELYTLTSKLKKHIANYRKQLQIQQAIQISKSTVTKADTRIYQGIERIYQQGAISKDQRNQYLSKAAQAQADEGSNAYQIKELMDKVGSAQAEVRSSLARFIRKSFIFAPGNTRAINFVSPQMTEVNNGDQIMTLQWETKVAPNTVPVFLKAKPSTQIGLGMETILTPIGFNVAEVGGIKGKITSFDEAFLSQDDISRRLGSEGYGKLVSPEGGSLMAYVELKREDHQKLQQLSQNANSDNNRGGFVWNNRSNPPIRPRQGFILSAQVTTRYRSPISMLIPALKEFSGAAIPSRLIDVHNGLGQ